LQYIERTYIRIHAHKRSLAVSAVSAVSTAVSTAVSGNIKSENKKKKI
jgi:hypothetical protein